jgi:hypothetical protein
VHRSRLRSFKERLVARAVPIYHVYRCHHCNWRGWLPRSGTSRTSVRLFIIGYVVLALVLAGAAIFLVYRLWPHARFKY